ncbi:hypothetical protein Pelo_6881 [Pelomyxa schiedti]|nr:hypothetical protein Pelo_6881 [Pelomyxa schiedti]
MFIEACINGHTEVASWLRDAVSFSMESLPGSEPKIPAHELLSNVCFQGHNQTAKWLRGLGFTLTSFDVSSIKSWALSSGRMEMVKWLIETFPSSKAEYIPRYLVCCCKTADVDSFEWILQKMPAICDADMDISEIFQTLAERNSFEMAQHVLKRLKNGRFLQPAASTKCFGLICRQGNIEFAEWFNSQFSQHDRQQKHHLEFVHEGLASGNLAACQWIIKTFNIPEPFDVTKEEILLLCSKHHVEIVHWISTFPSFQELLPSEKCSAFAAVASTWDLEFTKWMALQCSHSVDSESSLLQNELNRLITSSCLAGNLSFLQWLCDDFTFDEATIQLCAITAFSSGKLEIIDWILHDYIPNKAPPSSSLSQSLHPTTPEGNTLVKKTLMHCCRHSDLERAKSLANVFHITADEVRYNSNLPLVICCTSGFVDMAQWLFENFLQLSDLDDVEPYVKQQCVATGNMSGSLWLRSKLSSFKSGS